MWWVITGALALAQPMDAGAPPVRVGTFNVWGLPWPLAPRRAKRLAAIDAWLHDEDFDVVGLQEAWRGARSHLSDTLHYPAVRGDSGLALYTRHPIERLGFVPFIAQRGPDRFKTKGVWWVRVELPSGPVSIGVVHLQAGRREKSALVRQQQVETLLSSRPDGPLVLLGDFNLHRGDPVDAQTHEQLLAGGLVESQPARDAGTSRYGRHRLDRMYVSLPARWTASRARTRRDVEHSDHYPVTLKLEVSGPR